MDAYKVVRKIGVGTYGSACLCCLRQDPSQLFVLKKVKIDEDNDKERTQAEMEVAVLSQLDHPLVLGWVGWGGWCWAMQVLLSPALMQLRSTAVGVPWPMVLVSLVVHGAGVSWGACGCRCLRCPGGWLGAGSACGTARRRGG